MKVEGPEETELRPMVGRHPFYPGTLVHWPSTPIQGGSFRGVIPPKEDYEGFDSL